MAALQHHAVDLGEEGEDEEEEKEEVNEEEEKEEEDVDEEEVTTGESMQILHMASSSMVSPSSRWRCSCCHSRSTIRTSSSFSTQPLKFTLANKALKLH